MLRAGTDFMKVTFVILICSHCGKSYTGRRHRTVSYCPDCRRVVNLERMRSKRLKQKYVPMFLNDLPGLEEAVARNVIGLTVVHDPMEVGGFRAGTYFGHDDWIAMMKRWSFTPGTILRDATGREYQTPIEHPHVLKKEVKEVEDE